MKILHLLDSLGIGGKERFTVSLAALQVDRGMGAAIVTLGPGNAFAAELQSRGIAFASLERKKSWDFRLAAELRAMMEKGGYRILHCHNETAAIYGALANPRPPGRVIVTLHNGDRGAYPLKNRIENRLAFTRAWRLVAVSENIAATMRQREFCPASKIEVIENGIEAIRPPDALVTHSLRREFALDGEDLLVVCVGRLDPVKNHVGFLDAFAEVTAKVPRLKLVLVGDGPMRPGVENKIRALGLEGKVRLTGFRNDISAVLALADIFALPSFQEGQSISLLEACSAGKAVLASDRGGTPSIVAEGKSALLVDPDSRESMAHALFRLADGKSLRQSLGIGALAAYQGRFSLETCHRNYTSLYGRALGLKPS